MKCFEMVLDNGATFIAVSLNMTDAIQMTEFIHWPAHVVSCKYVENELKENNLKNEDNPPDGG